MGGDMQLDQTHNIDDLSRPVIMALIERIKRSHAEEQLIYRESELDEVWRLLSLALNAAQSSAAPATEIQRLKSLLAATMEAHDLVGISGNVAAAAARLQLMALEFPIHTA